MARKQPKRSIGRTPFSKCWYLADAIQDISQAVRYANKPADLTFPISELRNMTRRLDLMREWWFLSWIKSKSESLKLWPKLYERYL